MIPFLYLLSRAQTGILLAFDLPPQVHPHPDHPLAPRAAGRVGAPIASLHRRAILHAALPPHRPPTTISISGYHIREAGSDAVQEIAFTLADGIAYVEAALAAGMAVDEFGPRLSFFFNAHNVLIEEVAKFRAARRLWARIMRERFGAKDPKSWQLRFHAQTAGSSLQGQQPLVNVVRTTVQALAATLGGAQSLHTNSFDEALALPTEASARLALRTQQVLAHESGLGDWVDPLGGAYAAEAMTRELETRSDD